MRFTCDACSAKYSIADDRVKGRILKIRCKACNHIITVREDEKSKPSRLPAAAPPAIPAETRKSATQDAIDSAFGPPPDDGEHTMVSSNPGLLLELQRATEKPAAAAAAPAAVEEWFVSFDGDQEGPLSLAKARERIATEHPKGRECFAWKAGFFVWLPVEEVPELKDAAQKKAAVVTNGGNGHHATATATATATAAAQAQKTLMGEAPVLPSSSSQSGVKNGHTNGGAGGDLLITEASALINLDHLRAAAMAKPAAAPAGPAVGPTATFDPLPSSVDAVPSAGTPAPVVVMTGPAPRRTSGAIKWVAVFGVLLTVGLGGSLAYVLVTKSNANPTVATPDPTTPKKADDRPIQFIDPSNPNPQPTVDPKAPVAAKKVGTGPVAAGTGAGAKTATPNPAATKTGPQLNAAQKNLASLYAEEGDTTSPRPLAVGERKEKNNGQVDILSVVTQNKRSLNMCYERVLKRDNTLKRARVVTQVKVGMSGIVQKVTIPDPQYADSEIGQCLTQAIKKWRFPSQDSEYETEFPILLQAE